MLNFEAMLRALRDFDVSVFRFINVTLHNDLLAAAMKWTANDIFLLALVFGGVIFLVLRGGKREQVNAAFALWSLILANLTSTFLLKPFFKRLIFPKG